MDFRQLRFFITIAETGGITRASLQLNIAQPALSRQLRALEEELGFPLLERKTRGIALTPAGASFLQTARELLDRMERGREQARALFQKPAKLLRIGMHLHPYMFAAPFSGYLKTFQAEHPELDLQVVDLPLNELLPALEDGRVEASVLFSRPPGLQGLKGLCIGRLPLGVVYCEKGPWRQHPPRRLADLEGHPMIGIDPSRLTSVHERLQVALKKAGFRPRLAQTVHDVSAALALVEMGVGFAFVSEYMVQAATQTQGDQGLRWVLLEDLDVAYEAEFAWRRGTCPPPLRQFLDYLKKRL